MGSKNSGGIQDGEFVKSAPNKGKTKRQNEGSLIQVRGFYPPSAEGLSELSDTDIRDRFNHFAFFRDKSLSERKQWLTDNHTLNNDLYLHDVVGLQIKIYRWSGDFIVDKLGVETITRLIKGNPADPDGYWNIRDVFNMFPGKPGSKSQRPTLIFRPGNWMVVEDERRGDFNGVFFSLTTLKLNMGAITRSKHLKLFVFEKYAIVDDESSMILKWNDLVELVGGSDVQTIRAVKPIIAWFSPSIHKSLIQKLIRTRCETVEHDAVMYPARAVLICSILTLLLHPGSFNPNIQRFVTGLESAFKRVAVSIHEDSFWCNPADLTALYAASKVSQENKDWTPSVNTIKLLCHMATGAQTDRRLFEYNFHTFKEKENKMEAGRFDSFNYVVLKDLKSFETDINMVGSIAQNRSVCAQYLAVGDGMKVMPLIHCIDHHSLAEIVHYMPYSNTAYEDVIDNVWTHVVGANPRREKYSAWTESSAFVRDVRIAQRLLWMAHALPKQDMKQDKTTSFEYSLNESWLVGLVGPHEFRVGSATAIVVMRSDDIYQYVCVRKPPRNAKADTTLTELETIKARTMMINRLKTGIVLKHVPTALSQFKNATLTLVSDSYVVTKNGKSAAWSDAIHLRYEMPIHPHITPSIENAIMYRGDGVMKGCNMKDAILNVAPLVMRRLSTYLRGFRSKIELHKVARSGKGVNLEVVPEDTAVFKILCTFACMYPGALEKTTKGFDVKNGPMVWTFAALVERSISVEGSLAWIIPKPDERVGWHHQIDIVQTMVDRHAKGKRGQIMWVPVGMGKTYCTTSFIHHLIKTGQMPKYCVWTLPPSAKTAVIKEFERSHLPFAYVEGANLKPYVINVVLHDKMRLGQMHIQLKELAPQMLFVVDEFHNAINDTIRTSITLDTVRLSALFVALSGTIIKDINHTGLIQWLEQVVEFEVTEYNYWCAMAALISRKISTQVIVNRVEVEAPLVNPGLYYSMVPKSVGGTATSIQFKEAIAECYVATTRCMIEKTIENIDRGEMVLLVAKDIEHQTYFAGQLQQYNTHLITTKTPLSLSYDEKTNIQLVITTMQHVEGYTMTRARVLITSVYFSNQATREQLSGRINRLCQKSPYVTEIIVHTGLLTYIMKRYELARSLSEALRGFAKDIGVDDIRF